MHSLSLSLSLATVTFTHFSLQCWLRDQQVSSKATYGHQPPRVPWEKAAWAGFREPVLCLCREQSEEAGIKRWLHLFLQRRNTFISLCLLYQHNAIQSSRTAWGQGITSRELCLQKKQSQNLLSISGNGVGEGMRVGGTEKEGEEKEGEEMRGQLNWHSRSKSWLLSSPSSSTPPLSHLILFQSTTGYCAHLWAQNPSESARGSQCQEDALCPTLCKF